jgi:hypothetical protein
VPLPRLSPVGLVICVHACASLCLSPCMPWYFREFLARSVERKAPDLAVEIIGWTEDELAGVYDAIRRRQADDLD